MSFKFSFFSEESDADQNTVVPNNEATAKEDAREIFIKGDTLDSEKVNYAQIKLVDGLLIKYIQEAERHVITDSSGCHTDLIPGVYEGGRKTWECAYILLDFLSEYISADEIAGRSVLEVGCGSSLPGLYCLAKGACVSFQDYNKDVIEDITIPNVQLTCEGNSKLLERCRFYSGDWECFSELLCRKQIKYDIMLASETLYNTESYSKLHNLFSKHISDDGVIYVASKYHYFGVGGGIESFKQYVYRCGEFLVETVFTSGENLKCVILKLTKTIKKSEVG
ncbi:METTL18 [Bugula neritina]|uniref:protein-histidine N-methyltransferase n=1 Tax=Bugula neritina TaxID=10212 RepID=A0A7J7KPG6_BUGNE|nr:METTL18 [Bugula neritina]